MGLRVPVGVAVAASSAVLVVMVAVGHAAAGRCSASSAGAIDRLRVPGWSAVDRGARGALAVRWSRVVQRPAVAGRRPRSAVCSPSPPRRSALRFGFPDAGNDPRDYTTRRRLRPGRARASAPASTARCCWSSTCRRPRRDAAAAELSRDAVAPSRRRGLRQPAALNAAGDVAVLAMIPATVAAGPRDRGPRPPPARRRAAGGHRAATASRCSSAARRRPSSTSPSYVADRLPLFIGAVLVLSFLLLLVCSARRSSRSRRP